MFLLLLFCCHILHYNKLRILDYLIFFFPFKFVGTQYFYMTWSIISLFCLSSQKAIVFFIIYYLTVWNSEHITFTWHGPFPLSALSKISKSYLIFHHLLFDGVIFPNHPVTHIKTWKKCIQNVRGKVPRMFTHLEAKETTKYSTKKKKIHKTKFLTNLTHMQS